MLKQLCRGVLNLFLLRGGPQELPYSPLTLICLIAAGILVGFIASGRQVIFLINNMAFMLAIVWALLYFIKKQDRYIQTMIALISCGWIMSILFLTFWYGVLLLTAVSGHLNGISISNLSTIFSLEIKKDTLPFAVDIVMMLGIMTLLVWKLLIDILIIRQATEWRIWRTLGFIILLNLIPALVQKNFLEPQSTNNSVAVQSISVPATTVNNITPTIPADK